MHKNQSSNPIKIWVLRDLQSQRHLPHLQQALSWLDSRERESLKRFRREEDQRRYLLSHALVRHALSQVDSSQSPETWTWTRGKWGKPQWKGWQVSLSHTRDLAICAISAHDPIGIDAEDLRRKVQWQKVVGRFFHPSERQILLSLPESLGKVRFFQYWTLKEACLKALGTGFHTPMQKCRIKLQKTLGIVLEQDVFMREEIFGIYGSLNQTHTGALVVLSDGHPAKLFRCDMTTLKDQCSWHCLFDPFDPNKVQGKLKCVEKSSKY